MYARTTELQKKAFRINSQNIEQAIGILVTFMSEINLQEEKFLAKYDCFLPTYASTLNPFYFRRGIYVRMELKKTVFTLKSKNTKEGICFEVTFRLEIQLLNVPF